MNPPGETASPRTTGLIRIAALAIVLPALWFTQPHRTEALLCIPLLCIGHPRLIAILTAISGAIMGTVALTHIPRLGIAAFPGALHNTYFGPIQSGHIILITAVLAIAWFALNGALLAKPKNDPIAGFVLPGRANIARVAIACVWPMLPIVALPFGLVSLRGAIVWAITLALLQHALWTHYGRKYPDPVETQSNKSNPTGVLGLAAVTLAALVPFVIKPFHIDDPAYLWTAQQIVKDPINFYGYYVHMMGMRIPMHMEMQNPPLFSYFLAAAALVLGWGEIPMHLVSIAFALAAILGTYILARHFCTNAWAAALAVLCTPGFYVSATTVMCDVPMIAFYVWAIIAWLKGYDRSRHALLLTAAILVALSALTKYFGMTLIPLLFVYAVVRSRGLRPRQLHLILPVAALTAYELWTRHYYGRGLLLGASEYVRAMAPLMPQDTPPAWLVGAIFTGGSIGAIALTGIAAARKKTIALSSIALIAATLIAAAGLFAIKPGTLAHLDTLNLSLAAIFAALAVPIVALAAIDFIRNPGPHSLLLGCWLGGSLLFCISANWSVTVRALLPAVVPAAILMVRQLETAQGPTRVRQNAWRILAATGASLILAILITRGDQAMARYDRATAQAIAQVQADHPSQTGALWFDGRWGLEYYLRTYGGKSLVAKELQPGDRVAIPESADLQELLPERQLQHTFDVFIPRRAVIHTMFAGAGFYSSLFGPLPYAIGEIPHEVFRLYTVIN